MTTITTKIAKKVLQTVDKGLSSGMGNPVPGEMCVEAAVCYALGLPHGDDPSCVSRAVRALKIQLNDSNWSSKTARAKGMRRLALIQLGSAGVLDDEIFAKKVSEYSIRVFVPVALRAAASLQKDIHHKGALEDAATLCEKEGTESAAWSAARSARSAARSARSAAESARSAARSAWSAAESARSAGDKVLSDFAEGVVQILISMDAPGKQWLYLTE